MLDQELKKLCRISWMRSLHKEVKILSYIQVKKKRWCINNLCLIFHKINIRRHHSKCHSRCQLQVTEIQMILVTLRIILMSLQVECQWMLILISNSAQELFSNHNMIWDHLKLTAESNFWSKCLIDTQHQRMLGYLHKLRLRTQIN